MVNRKKIIDDINKFKLFNLVSSLKEKTNFNDWETVQRWTEKNGISGARSDYLASQKKLRPEFFENVVVPTSNSNSPIGFAFERIVALEAKVKALEELLLK